MYTTKQRTLFTLTSKSKWNVAEKQMNKFNLTLTKGRCSYISPLKEYFNSGENMKEEIDRIAILDKALFFFPIPFLFDLIQFYCMMIFTLNQVAMEITVRSGIT